MAKTIIVGKIKKKLWRMKLENTNFKTLKQEN